MPKAPPQPRLKLYTHFLRMASEWAAEQPADELDPDFLNAIDVMRYGTIFDCRQLPLDFIEDSGIGYPWEINWLPYPECYFELADGTGIVAWRDYENDSSPVFFTPMDYIKIPDDDRDVYETRGALSDDAYVFRCPVMGGLTGILEAGFKAQEEPTPEVVEHMKALGEQPAEMCRRAADILKGIICLLTEKLVLDRIVPDSVPALNKARKKKGKLPLDAEHHVITLYVPGIKYAVSRHAGKHRGGTHASPMLHWRRGHERVLSRGTPDELHTTVRRHLVGDPDKGFSKPSYRLLPRKGAV